MNISTKTPQMIGASTPEKSPEKSQSQIMDQKLRDVSKMYENHFLNEIMKAMRSTVQESGFVKVNQGEKIFREKLDNEYVDKWADRGGIGLADVIYNQLIEKFGPQMGLKTKEAPPRGPLQLRPQDTLQMKRLGTTDKSITYSVQSASLDQMDIGQTESQAKQKEFVSISVSNPWSGKLAQKIQLSADEYFLKIQHPQMNLTSGLHWRGTSLPFEVGQEMGEGEVLGSLNPDQKSVVWSLQSQPGTVSHKNVSE
jgi:flagellar protein FlgJ